MFSFARMKCFTRANEEKRYGSVPHGKGVFLHSLPFRRKAERGVATMSIACGGGKQDKCVTYILVSNGSLYFCLLYRSESRLFRLLFLFLTISLLCRTHGFFCAGSWLGCGARLCIVGIAGVRSIWKILSNCSMKRAEGSQSERHESCCTLCPYRPANQRPW